MKTYAVTVDGHPPILYSARTASKARARAWRDYNDAYDSPFRFFMKVAFVRRVPDPPGAGERILVCGEPAIRVLPVGLHSVYYVRENSDVVYTAHQMEVAPAPTTGGDNG